jgi:hypothetical protein
MTAFEIITNALLAMGVSQEEIDKLKPVVPQWGDNTPENQKLLARVRRLVELHKERVAVARSSGGGLPGTDYDPVVGCAYTEGRERCTINIDWNTWKTIQERVDPYATSGPPVPASQEGWVSAQTSQEGWVPAQSQLPT